MKKNSKKLAIRKNTLRLLTDLDKVTGGLPESTQAECGTTAGYPGCPTPTDYDCWSHRPGVSCKVGGC